MKIMASVEALSTRIDCSLHELDHESLPSAAAADEISSTKLADTLRGGTATRRSSKSSQNSSSSEEDDEYDLCKWNQFVVAAQASLPPRPPARTGKAEGARCA
jgi:hypothetical protein